MDISDKNYKYELGLVLLGGAIGYVSTFYGGVAIMLVLGAIIALLIGVKSNSFKNAILLGAFFGIVIVTSSSQLAQGYSSDWNDDILASVFLPYLKDALIAALLASTVAAIGHTLKSKRSR